MLKIRCLVVLVLGAASSGCGCPSSGTPELVLAPESRLQVQTRAGTLTINSGKGFARSYEWDGCVIHASPCPRVERWYGSLGIYDPAPGFMYLRRCKGISRPVVQEGQQHFLSVEDAWWLNLYAKAVPEGTAWTDDGLVVQWLLTPGRAQLSVDVMQICILGERPKSLPGSSSSSFVVTSKASASSARVACVSVSREEMEHSRRIWEESLLTADEYTKRVLDRRKKEGT